MSGIDWIRQWLDKAENDLLAANRLFHDYHPKQLDISGYHCQQAAEKALKAVIISFDLAEDVPRTHDLELLLELCLALDKGFELFRTACFSLNPMATRTRYPDGYELTEADVEAALHAAQRIVDFCAAKIMQKEES